MTQLSQPQVAALLLADGANVQQAAYFTAIEGRESHGNSDAYNGVPPDNSYGLFQVNMIGPLGPARRAAFGIQSNEALFDPATNVHAAKVLSSGWTNLQPWQIGGNPLANTDLPAAAAAVQVATSGNVVLPDASTAQTPSTGPGQDPAGAGNEPAFQLKLATIAGQDIGPTVQKSTVVKVALVVFGGLLVVVGLWALFQTAGGKSSSAAPRTEHEHEAAHAAELAA